jgi:hypothetical protein
MRTLSRNRFLRRVAGICLAASCLHPLPLPAQDAAKAKSHLFILSGQSNMTGGLVNGFTAVVEEEFGKENVAVAMSMKSGRGLRFWCSDYRYADNRKTGAQEQADNGSQYQPLITAAKAAAGDKSFDTVTFIWMQGESDASRGWAEVYAENFLKLLGRLKADMKREDMRFVIGRISDHDLENPNWKNMREAQVKLAENHAGGAWIDTDDLNGGGEGVPGGDLHYPKEESEKLGARFAGKAIIMIRGDGQPNENPLTKDHIEESPYEKHRKRKPISEIFEPGACHHLHAPPASRRAG